MDDNLHYLKLLSVFHYVVGGIAALFACIPAVHLILGISLIVASRSAGSGNDVPPEFIGWVFALFGGAFIILGWTFAACVITAGRSLARRTRYTFCLVMGCVECIFMPFGTVLGVFTIIVLSKPDVKEVFDGTSPAGARAP